MLEHALLPAYNWPDGFLELRTGIGVACLALSLSLSIQYLAFRRSMRAEIASALRATGASAGHAARSELWMLGFESAVTTVLVFGAIVFALSLRRVEALDVGVDLDHTMVGTFTGQEAVPK
ncbi:MAG TPA: hypothetical protein VG963_02665, partial [Polyangiaceae bacterium]|nr:hypothetical protein [Polyangiaceae bacterium]